MLIGLFLAFVSVAEEALAEVGEESRDDALGTFERATGSRGRTKTLTLRVPDNQRPGSMRNIGIRGAYNDISSVARGRELRRFDYPSSSPHATQEWTAYADDVNTIFAMTPGERRALADELWQLVVELPRHERRTVSRSVTAPFAMVLEDFRPAGAGIPTGAVLQGLAYGFMRADAPTLNFRTAKVRSGGRRDGRVGDIDGYYGADIALAAEVKDFAVDDFGDIEDFLTNLGPWQDAVAFVVCASASPEVVAEAAHQDITVITRAQLVDAVRLWPVQKQMDAVRAAVEYFVHIEQKDALVKALMQFFAKRGIDIGFKVSDH